MLVVVQRRTVPGVLAAALLLAGCAACGSADPSGPTGSAPGPDEYLPGLEATVELPDGAARAVVLVVPGGGFSAADPTGLLPLGEDLAAEGIAAVTITYGHAGTDTFYPEPVDQVRCAIAYAAAQAPEVPVVVVGHSAGANLAMLAGLQPLRTDVTCPYEPRAADAVVGLAGPYDVHRTYIGEDLFGVPQAEDPETWRAGNPLTWAAERAEVPTLLVHGTSDELVPVEFTEQMAAALTEGGHDVVTVYPNGARHNDVFLSDWVLEDLVRWVDDVVLAPAED
jgi:acetyl esterase/lipase